MMQDEVTKLTEICNHFVTFHSKVIIDDAILAFHNRLPLQSIPYNAFYFYWILYISFFIKNKINFTFYNKPDIFISIVQLVQFFWHQNTRILKNKI